MPVQQMAPSANAPAARPQAPNVPSVDISIEPIACDEPIPTAGFPPLPDRLDLPVAGSSGSWMGGSPSGAAAGGGSAGGGMTMHQHYGHVTIPDVNRTSGNGYGQAPVSGGPPGGGVGYYKVKSMPIDIPNSSAGVGYYKAKTMHIDIPDHSAPGQGTSANGVGYDKAKSMDVYNTNSTAQPGQPGYTGAGDKDLKALGKEPQLNGDGTQAAETPQAVPVNQSATQDLSLPEDDFTYKYKQTSGAEKLGKSAAKGFSTILRTLPAAAGAF